MNREIFVDLDGVLADFVKAVKVLMPFFEEGKSDKDKTVDRQMWAAISRYQKHQGGRLWAELDLMPGAMDLWDYIKGRNPQILTATGSPSFGAGDQKLEWVAKHFGSQVKVNITQRAVEKAQYAKEGYILIDDKMKAIEPWQLAGGTGILHTSAATSIEQLKALGL